MFTTAFWKCARSRTLPIPAPPALSDTGRYRIFLVPPERSIAEHPDGVCSFAAEFVAAFSFFLEADIDRAQALSFSGNRTPEFPAVLELNN